MALAFEIPGPLRPFAGDRATVEVAETAGTVAQALAALFRLHPGLRDRVTTERGEIRPHVHVFVDGEEIGHGEGLETAVRDGAEIVILPAVSGG